MSMTSRIYLSQVVVMQPHSSKVLHLLFLFLELLHVSYVNQPNWFIDMD